MDFISYVENQKDKLSSFDYPNNIWNLINNYETNINVSATIKQEYKYHLPIDFKDFLTSCIEKLDDIQRETGEILLGEHLRIYILTLIYWCLQDEEEIDMQLLASEFYIRLISLKDNICFKSCLYTSSLHIIDQYLTQNILPILKQLKILISTQPMELEHKQITLDLLVNVLKNRSSSIITSFEIETSSKIDHLALLCMRAMALKEETNLGLFSICMGLLSGTRSTVNSSLSRQNIAILQSNMKYLIKDLHQKILDGSYSALRNALVYCWTLQDLEYYDYVVTIMNDLDAHNYQSLMEKLRSMIISKDDICKKNLIRLSYAILSNPSSNYTPNKLEVVFQTLIRSIIINTCSSNIDVCDTAIEAISNMCSSKSQQVDKNFKIILESDLDMINKDTFLKRLEILVDIKWKNKSRNKCICIIVCYLMTHIDISENISICIQILKMLSEEATPFYLKPCLLTLTSVYVQMKKQERESLASAVFDILYKMSMHPAATSTEFLKHMYGCTLYPVKIDGISYDGELFIIPLISEDYNFEEFFKKCDSLGLLKPEHVKKLITELNRDSCAHLKLLCAILEYITFTEFLPLTDFILNNFDALIDNVNTKYHLYALNKILSKRRGTIDNTTTFDKVYHLKVAIESCIKEQKFPSKVIGNALSLLKTLNTLTCSGISADTIEACNKSLEETLSNIHSNTVNSVPILYASEMALLMDYIPNEVCKTKLDEILKYFSSSASKTDQQQSYDIWTFCLVLQTALAMQSKDFVELTINYLRFGIKSKSDVVKLTSIRLLYDISNVITRNFENLVEIMFGELTGDSTIIKKICVGYIEKLVRDEYLRLNTSQYLRLMCLLRDRTDGMDEHIKKLLTENFIISHQSTIAKNFVPLVIQFNEYKKHPVIQMDKHVLKAVHKTNQSAVNKKDMYTFLFKPLTTKSQFNVLKELCSQIFSNIIEEKLKCDTGYWEMINDALLIVKISSSESHHTLSQEKFYAKNINTIDKNIIERNKQYSEKPKYIEFQNDIKHITHTLLKLLFFNESDRILRNIKLPLFDAIIYWTNYHLSDIVHLVHEENSQRIKILYSKLPNFYKKEIQASRNSRTL